MVWDRKLDQEFAAPCYIAAQKYLSKEKSKDVIQEIHLRRRRFKYLLFPQKRFQQPDG